MNTTAPAIFKIRESVPARENQTELRIMTWNILSEELTPEAQPIKDRIEIITDVIRDCAPDAAGIQEISESCYGLLSDMLGDTYTFVNPMTHAGNYSFTGIMYNHTKYELLDTDIHVYPWGNKRIRIANWIHLKEKEGEREFVLVSTHWDVHACNRVPQAEYMAGIVRALKAKFACSVITTGDFNAKEDSNAFKTFIRSSGHKETKYACDEAINNCFTGHNVGIFEPQQEGTLSIDHITTTPDMSVLHYETLVNEDIVNVSDHYPIYVDLKF